MRRFLSVVTILIFLILSTGCVEETSLVVSRKPKAENGSETEWRQETILLSSDTDETTSSKSETAAAPSPGNKPLPEKTPPYIPPTPEEPKTIGFREPHVTLFAGQEYRMSPSNYYTEATGPVSWLSSDEAVATVGEDGVVTAKSAGTATIFASSTDGYSGSYEITVLPSLAAQTTVQCQTELPALRGYAVALGEVQDCQVELWDGYRDGQPRLFAKIVLTGIKKSGSPKNPKGSIIFELVLKKDGVLYSRSLTPLNGVAVGEPFRLVKEYELTPGHYTLTLENKES